MNRRIPFVFEHETSRGWVWVVVLVCMGCAPTDSGSHDLTEVTADGQIGANGTVKPFADGDVVLPNELRSRLYRSCGAKAKQLGTVAVGLLPGANARGDGIMFRQMQECTVRIRAAAYVLEPMRWDGDDETYALYQDESAEVIRMSVEAMWESVNQRVVADGGRSEPDQQALDQITDAAFQLTRSDGGYWDFTRALQSPRTDARAGFLITCAGRGFLMAYPKQHEWGRVFLSTKVQLLALNLSNPGSDNLTQAEKKASGKNGQKASQIHATNDVSYRFSDPPMNRTFSAGSLPSGGPPIVIQSSASGDESTQVLLSVAGSKQPVASSLYLY